MERSGIAVRCSAFSVARGFYVLLKVVQNTLPTLPLLLGRELIFSLEGFDDPDSLFSFKKGDAHFSIIIKCIFYAFICIDTLCNGFC